MHWWNSNLLYANKSKQKDETSPEVSQPANPSIETRKEVGNSLDEQTLDEQSLQTIDLIVIFFFDQIFEFKCIFSN